MTSLARLKTAAGYAAFRKPTGGLLRAASTHRRPWRGGGGVVAPYQLAYAPPVLTDPTTILVTDAMLSVVMDVTKDYRILLPGAVGNTAQQTPKTSGLILSGGRNVVMIGGAIRIDQDAKAGVRTTQRGVANRALHLSGWAGTLHVEGVYIGGVHLYEAVNITTKRAGAILVMENIYIDDVILKTPVSGGSHDGGDSMQNWDGPSGGYYVDYHTTRCSTYQGFFFQPAQFGTAVPARMELRHIDIDHHAATRYPDRRQPWPYGNSNFGRGNVQFHEIQTATQVVLEDVWFNPYENIHAGSTSPLWGVKPDPTYGETARGILTAVGDEQHVTWPGIPRIQGHLTAGRRPGGSLVRPEYVGLGYISPGYLGTSPSTS